MLGLSINALIHAFLLTVCLIWLGYTVNRLPRDVLTLKSLSTSNRSELWTELLVCSFFWLVSLAIIFLVLWPWLNYFILDGLSAAKFLIL